MPATAERPQAGRRVDYYFPLWPKQQYAFESPATEILFGGAAGPGKSHLMRVALINWCFEIPGLQCFLFRRIYEDLIKNHMEGDGSFPELLAGAVNDGLVTITTKRIAFWNGARIFLNHLQLQKHLRKYQGTTFHVLAIDELTHFEENHYRYLRGRTRMTREMQAKLPEKYRHPVYGPLFPRLLSGSNPGGEGHNWVKKTFVNPGPFTIYKQPDSEGGKLRQFIPAKMADNPSLNREEYEKTLSGLGDPVLIRALRDGDWRIASGSMFGETWRDEQYGRPWHVHPGFRLPHYWELWRGADDGHESPFAGYWLSEDPHYKTIYVVDELYGKHMLPETVAERVKSRDLELELQDMSKKPGDPRRNIYNLTILRGGLDNAAFTDTGQTDHKGQKIITRGEQMNRLGCRWDPIEKWPGSRVAGIQNLHRLLSQNLLAPKLLDRDGKEMLDAEGKALHDRPGIVFFKRCVNAIEQIPALPRSLRNIEDVADVDFDHSFDGVRYGVQYRRGKFSRVRVGGL